MTSNQFKLITSLPLLVIGLLVGACEKDNFTDPNDPRFGTLEDEITLNLDNTFQTIDHFGASGGFAAQWVGKWPEASKAPIAQLFFSTEMDSQGNPEGIGLSMWRVNIGEGSAEQANSGFSPNAWFRETECFLNEDGTYDWSKQAGSQWFMAKARDYGVDAFTAWITAPPYFMSKNGLTFRTSGVPGFNCQEDKYQDYAEFLSAVAQHYESEGFNLEVLCPFNETQYEWSFNIGEASQSGTKALNNEVATVTRLISQQFIDDGVNAKIMIPETAQLRYLFEGTGNTENQLAAFFDESSDNYLGDLPNLSNHIAAHSYFSNGTPEESIRQRKGVRTALKGFGNNLDYWQTEYSLLGTAYQQGKDVSDLKEIDYALWMARIIHTDLKYGDATGWSFWTALNLSNFQDHPNRFNLILYQPNSNGPTHTDGTFRAVKNLWALGNFSRFVRPGMVRFEVLDPAIGGETDEVTRFMMTGYKNSESNDLVLVCVNNQEEARPLAFAKYGESFEIVEDTFTLYETSDKGNMTMSTASYDEIVIPAKSIVTLTAKLQ